MQSIARVNDVLNPASTYYESYLLLPYMVNPSPDPRILIAGAGAGTIPHLLSVHVSRSFPEMELEAVEIDPRATELGYLYFGSIPEECTVHTADGRSFMDSAEGAWDIIVTETYSNQIYIPFHLTTLEYFSAMKGRLAPGGIAAMNVNALDETSEQVFALVYLAPVAGDYNYMLLAFDSPITAPDGDSMGVWNPDLQYTAQLFQPAFEPFQPCGGMILTDNRAPVEFMTDLMIARGASETM